MYNLVTIFIQSNMELDIENCIDIYLKNNRIINDTHCIHITPLQNSNETIKYTQIHSKYYTFLEEIIIDLDKYDYIFLITNDYLIDKHLDISDIINKFDDCIHSITINGIKNNKVMTDYINSSDYRYQSYKQIFETNDKKSYADLINYEYYANNKYNSEFGTSPSIIRVTKEKIPIWSNSIYSKQYESNCLQNGFKNINLGLDLLKNEIRSSSYNPKVEEITIVTGFIKVNDASKKHKYDYLERSRATLSLPNPMVIFISEDLMDYVKKIRDELGLLDKTIIVLLTVKDFYMFTDKPLLDDCCKKNKSPYHNSLYIMAVNSRYKYLSLAIENNYFNTEYFGWVDFGLNHIVHMDNIRSVGYNNPLKIRIAWIARNSFAYNHKCLGGGIFIGHKEIMKIFCKLHDVEFRYNLSLGHCVNDDKTLFFIYLKYPELFDIYFSGYNFLYDKLLGI